MMGGLESSRSWGVSERGSEEFSLRKPPWGRDLGGAKMWPGTGRGRAVPCREVATARTLQQEPSGCSQDSRRDPGQGRARWALRGWLGARLYWVSEAMGRSLNFI